MVSSEIKGLDFVAETVDWLVRQAPALDRKVRKPWALRLNAAAHCLRVFTAPAYLLRGSGLCGLNFSGPTRPGMTGSVVSSALHAVYRPDPALMYVVWPHDTRINNNTLRQARILNDLFVIFSGRLLRLIECHNSHLNYSRLARTRISAI